MKDYSNYKPLPEKQDRMKCAHCGNYIGSEPEGENPDLPEHKDLNKGDENDAGTHKGLGEKDDGTLDFLPDEELDDSEQSTEGKRKKRSDDAIALFAASLGNKFAGK